MPAKTKRTNPVPRELEEIEAEMHQMASMSCRPGGQRPSLGAIIDENQSVKWNREEAQRRRDEYDQKVKDLNTQKNKWRDLLETELYERMVLDLHEKITTKGASRIFCKAYEDGHAYGVHEVFIHLRDLMELFDDVLSEGGEK